MITHHARVVGTLIALFALSSVQSVWAGPPTDQLREKVERVVKTLKDPELRGDTKINERRAIIGKFADEIFDFAETAKRALGRHWAERTPAEREDFVRVFTRLVQRTYISKVDQYSPEITFLGDTVDGDQAIVKTTVILSKGGELSLNYQMHQTKDGWLVYDLNVDGIGLVANYRTQFAKIIRAESYGALVARLRARQTEISAVSTGTADR